MSATAAECHSAGAAVTIPYRIVRTIRLMAAQTQAMAEVTAKAVAEVTAEAINPVRPWKTNGILIRCSKGF
jgi:hypothetical protein